MNDGQRELSTVELRFVRRVDKVTRVGSVAAVEREIRLDSRRKADSTGRRVDFKRRRDLTDVQLLSAVSDDERTLKLDVVLSTLRETKSLYQLSALLDTSRVADMSDESPLSGLVDEYVALCLTIVNEKIVENW